jgi:hypothetical protein
VAEAAPARVAARFGGRRTPVAVSGWKESKIERENDTGRNRGELRTPVEG